MSNLQQVQVLQGQRELGEEAMGTPTGLRGDAGRTVGRLMVFMQHKVFEGVDEALELSPRAALGNVPSGGIARQPRKQSLIHRVEEALDAAAPTRLADLREERLDFQVRADLL